MKNFKYLAASALITLSACGDDPKPSQAAQNAKASQPVIVETPKEGVMQRSKDTELVMAIKENNLRRAKALLENDNASVVAIDEKGYTALMLAAASGNTEMLESLLQYTKQNDTAVLDRGDESVGRTPLIIAAELANPDMITALRKKGANPNIVDNYQKFPLLLAAEKNSIDSVSALLREISGTTAANPSLQNSQGENAILEASKHKNLEMIKLIKEYGGNINSSDVDGITPLIYAVSINDIALFDALLGLGADINDAGTNRTPLSYSIDKKNLAFAKHILEKGADPNKTQTDMVTPIQVLITQEGADPEMARLLVEKGAKLSNPNEPKSILLSRAIRKGNAPVVKLLIEKGLQPVDLETTTKNGIIEALAMDEPEIALLMIENGANVSKTDENGFSALAIAAKKNYANVFEALVKAGADVNQVSRNASAVPLEVVIDSDNAELLRIMFNNGLKASPDAILLRAVSSEKPNIVPVTLAAGAKPNIMNTAGQPALWLATARDDTASAKALVEAGALLDVQDNEKAISPLSLAIARANMDLAAYYLEKGANPDLTDRNGFTSLTYAVIAGQSEMVKKLIAKGAQVKALDKIGRNLQAILNESKINPQKKQEIKAILLSAGVN